VAVLYSPGFGSGWYTWNSEYEELLFDTEMVEYVLSEGESMTREELEKYLIDKYPDIYIGSNIDDLRVYWVPQGEEFRIREYDGSEQIYTRSTDKTWHLA
jgi:hypothetical protein